MAKINIVFNNINYLIDESFLAAAVAELQTHLSAAMSGDGATIALGGASYSVDSTKLSTSASDFISHLYKIAGAGYKVVIGGVQYDFDPNKVKNAVAELEAVLGNLNNPDEEVDIVIILDEAVLDNSVLG